MGALLLPAVEFMLAEGGAKVLLPQNMKHLFLSSIAGTWKRGKPSGGVFESS